MLSTALLSVAPATLYSIRKSLVVELLGTLLLALSVLVSGHPAVIGATLAGATWVGNLHSGAHFNPAISILKSSMGRLPWEHLTGYVLAQVGGALLAWQLNTHLRKL